MCPYLNKICFEQVLRRQFQKITPTKVKRKIRKKSKIKKEKEIFNEIKNISYSIFGTYLFIYVVYFDQQMGALHTVCVSK